MTTVGYLHTSPVHVPTFERLTQSGGPTAKALHVVDEDALARARAGVAEDASEAVGAHLRDLVVRGADVIVCTCSTLGAMAEGVRDGVVAVPVLRVDRPMARRAVSLGARIGVVVALDSTIQPTLDLLREEADAVGRPIDVTVELAHGAWTHFEAGDHAAYLQAVAASARMVGERTDVVVLAQASMMGAVDLLSDLGRPVLTSPTSAVEHALSMGIPERA